MTHDGGPSSAFALGWAGVIPFAVLTLAIVAGWSLPVSVPAALISYGATILSFMAGVQWGVTMRADDDSHRGWRGYAVSVVPSLLAWTGLLLPPRAELLLIAATFAGLLGYDLWTVRRGYAPS